MSTKVARGARRVKGKHCIGNMGIQKMIISMHLNHLSILTFSVLGTWVPEEEQLLAAACMCFNFKYRRLIEIHELCVPAAVLLPVVSNKDSCACSAGRNGR